MKNIQKIVFMLLLVGGITTEASAQNVLTQIAYADSQIAYVYNPSAIEQFFVVQFDENTACSGTLAPYATAGCTIPAGVNWAFVSVNVVAYVTFNDSPIYAVPQYYGRTVAATYYTGLAVVNTHPYPIEMTFVLYNQYGQVESSFTGTLAAYGDIALFSHVWFSSPSIDWNEPHFIAIGSYDLNAVMACVCDISTGICGQI